jgi:polyhydroxyalkanoate synthesis repressor PhaR
MNISTDDQKAAGEKAALKIHKYSNRRYYDVTYSRHLTLEQIHKLILKGHDVKVIESKSGEDVTIELLAHIMLEHDASKLKVFTVEVLHQMMRTNDTLIHTFMDEYFNKALLTFLESQKAVKKYFTHEDRNVSAPVLTPLEMGAKWADAFMQPFASFLPGMPQKTATQNPIDEKKGARSQRCAVASKERSSSAKKKSPTHSAAPRVGRKVRSR